jgi:hypothetical protein
MPYFTGTGSRSPAAFKYRYRVCRLTPANRAISVTDKSPLSYRS